MENHFLKEHRVNTLSFLKDLAIAISGLIALFTFFNGLLEYKRQGAQKRVEHFVTLRRRLKENPAFKEITHMLFTNDPALAHFNAQDKRDYIGLLEEVALLVNSRLIYPDVAHYMFGHYTVHAYDSKYFWSNVERDEVYWTLFMDFAQEMKRKEKDFRYKRKNLHF